MAKSRSILELQGTISNLTFVDSRTYGKHVRVKRGTRKPADVNDSFKENSNYLIGANAPARMIKAALDPYCKNFGYGQLWQRLVSLFRAQLKEQGRTNLSGLEGLEVNTQYPFGKFMLIKATATVDVKEAALQVTLSYDSPPVFKKSKHIDGYRLSVIAIYPDMKTGIATTAVATSPVTDLKSKLKELQFQLQLPPEAKEYLLCVKLEGMEKGLDPGGMATKGMRFIPRVETLGN
jgi:hypothetical protein